MGGHFYEDAKGFPSFPTSSFLRDFRPEPRRAAPDKLSFVPGFLPASSRLLRYQMKKILKF